MARKRSQVQSSLEENCLLKLFCSSIRKQYSITNFVYLLENLNMSNVFVVFVKTFYDTNHYLIALHACDDIMDMSDAIFD